MRPRLLILCSLLAAANVGAQAPGNSMIVTTDWLSRNLSDGSVVVLHVVHDANDYSMGHIPGAREISYSDFTIARDGIGTELPPVERLQQVFEKLGVSDHSHVVIYAAGTGMAPMASRAFLSLDYLGHQNVSLLHGGLARWRAEGRPVSTEAPRITPGKLTPKPRTITVDANWVTAHTGQRGFSFIDTRTTPEYLGTGERGGLRSEGHIAGARQLEWQQLFANADSSLFLDRDALAKLYTDRIAPGDTVITYCLVGYRASMTYFGARVLGLPVRLYDGSYQDWDRRKLPVTKGETPAQSKELSLEARAAVGQRGRFLHIDERQGSPWPAVTVYVFVDATPEEATALFIDYNAHQSYIPTVRRSRISRVIDRSTVEVDYAIDLPVVSDVEYTVRNHLVAEGPGAYRVDWTLIKATSVRAILGHARFTPFTNDRTGRAGTLMEYYDFVTPGSRLAKIGFIRNRAIRQVEGTARAIARKVESERKNGELKDRIAALRAALPRT